VGVVVVVVEVVVVVLVEVDVSLCGTPVQSNMVSLAILDDDHTAQPDRPVLDLPSPGGWKADC